MGDHQRRKLPNPPAPAPATSPDGGVAPSNAALASDIPRVEPAPVLTPSPGAAVPWWADPKSAPDAGVPGPLSPAVPGAATANAWLADPTGRAKPQPDRVPAPSNKLDPVAACGGNTACAVDTAPKQLRSPALRF
ncbi:MAG: hypothetical protein ABMA64_38170 [Myxococcota bacterium]